METHADCLRIIDRAEKLVGEKLIEAKDSGEVARQGDHKSMSTASTSTLPDLGITRDQSADWQRRARTPDAILPPRRPAGPGRASEAPLGRATYSAGTAPLALRASTGQQSPFRERPIPTCAAINSARNSRCPARRGGVMRCYQHHTTPNHPHGSTMPMATDDSSGRNPSRNPQRISPLPGAPALDDRIAVTLARFDAVPRPVRDAAWATAGIITTLSAAGALRCLGFARRIQLRQQGGVS
jgi:hypothetical protein